MKEHNWQSKYIMYIGQYSYCEACGSLARGIPVTMADNTDNKLVWMNYPETDENVYTNILSDCDEQIANSVLGT